VSLSIGCKLYENSTLTTQYNVNGYVKQLTDSTEYWTYTGGSITGGPTTCPSPTPTPTPTATITPTPTPSPTPGSQCTPVGTFWYTTEFNPCPPVTCGSVDSELHLKDGVYYIDDDCITEADGSFCDCDGSDVVAYYSCDSGTCTYLSC
jgi:hypothetical protein